MWGLPHIADSTLETYHSNIINFHTASDWGAFPCILLIFRDIGHHIISENYPSFLTSFRKLQQMRYRAAEICAQKDSPYNNSFLSFMVSFWFIVRAIILNCPNMIQLKWPVFLCSYISHTKTHTFSQTHLLKVKSMTEIYGSICSCASRTIFQQHVLSQPFLR